MKKLYTIVLALGAYLVASDIKAQAPTFNQDVAPIIFKNCSPCHNPNGINYSLPFTTYSEVVGDTSSIRNDLVKNHMPPWPPDTTYTKFLHDRSLKIADKNKIIAWINAGAPKGTGTEPTSPSYKQTHRLAGKSSLTVGVGRITSNSTTTAANPYNCYVLPLKLTEDKWLRAAEIVPGNLKAVHHVVITIDTTGSATSQVTGSCNSQPGQFGIAGWSSGAAPVVYPNKAPFKAGQRIPKGSVLVAQIHFAPGSGGMIDSTKIRLYFYDNDDVADIRPVHDEVILQNWTFKINPNTITTVTVSPGGFNINPQTLKSINQPATDFSIISTNPHSHFVCTKIKNYAFGTHPVTGQPDTIRLININNWDYHWQGYYYHPKPIKIPSNYTLKSEHLYNNTSGNLHLVTDPNKEVSAGTATENEMFFDDFVWAEYQPGDENIDMEVLLRGDPIFATGLEEQPYEATLVGIENISENVSTDFLTISPNPASNRMNITITGQSVYSGYVYNVTGQTVLETGSFTTTTVVDVNNIPAGLYILEIVNNKTHEKTTKKLMVTH